MDLYGRIKNVAMTHGYTIKSLEQELGFGRGSISKFRIHSPSIEKIKQIASFLNEPISVFLDEEPIWYTDKATAEKALELFNNKEMRILFDAARDAKPEDLQAAADILLALKRREQYNDNDPS